ncbi:MAG TPA: hypothetical protein VFU15_10270 [Bacteroidia bacterium]|nr:hypothetical protein [Bacteroidia bacterium]
MHTLITVTKIASAYVDLLHNTPTQINADHISKLVPLSHVQGIGSTVIFFRDGSTMNVLETVGEVKSRVKEEQERYFEFGFGKN